MNVTNDASHVATSMNSHMDHFSMEHSDLHISCCGIVFSRFLLVTGATEILGVGLPFCSFMSVADST